MVNCLIRDEILNLYAELKQELDALPAKCYGCGKCCNFKSNGMRLYVQKFELDLIKEETNCEPSLKSDGTCVYQQEGLCTIHQIRPLGCRTYFSEDPNGHEYQDLYEKYHSKLKMISSKYAKEYEFVPFFNNG